MQLVLGRDICGGWNDAVGREWLVTNGLGGYACGTVAGANTRRYHGFLMASFDPPAARTLLVAKVDITVDYLGTRYALYANEFGDGSIDPHGFVQLESFCVEDGLPVWRYAVADALLEQRIFMAPAANTSYLRLQLLRGSAAMQVEFKPLVTYRDYHNEGRGVRPFTAAGGERCCSVTAFPGAHPYRLASSAGVYAATDIWYWNVLHREEFARGLDALEDLWGPGTFGAELTVGTALHFSATAENTDPAPAEDVLATRRRAARATLAALPVTAPPWIRSLAVAADQFIVRRGTAAQASTSVIAGYPWFTDWGRDTMIALPGLTTTLRRYDVTAAILRTFARFVDRGMLPNRFPDAGTTLEYNTADATLWLFQALREHLDARRDLELSSELFPVLMTIIQAHVEGTRYGIRVDPADGLLHAGEPGIQLTWMDAKQGACVFTPRIGKPVEINALWLNAIKLTGALASRMRKQTEQRYCQQLLERAEAGFARFWNEPAACLFDVIDGEDSASDAAVRPNQLFAVALPHCVLTREQMRAVVDVCARELLTSHGLRSVSPRHADYRGHYIGNAWQRDAAYHQGTVWSWLLGPFVRAHHRVYGDAAASQAYLAPMEQHLAAACVGSISEIFDGDAPHTARGCFAQAWSVAEILRSWVYLENKLSKP